MALLAALQLPSDAESCRRFCQEALQARHVGPAEQRQLYERLPWHPGRGQGEAGDGEIDVGKVLGSIYRIIGYIYIYMDIYTHTHIINYVYIIIYIYT